MTLFNFPPGTTLGRRIPKQKFYEHLDIPSDVKRAFVEQIRTIYWRNKLAPSTINLVAGGTVAEIEVFEVKLTGPSLDERVLRQIDRGIAYHILFLLEYDGQYKAAIGYKEATNSASSAFKVDRYYYSEWMPLEQLPLRIEGLDLDAAYEGLIRQIAGDGLQGGDTLKESIERQSIREQLESQIEALDRRIRKENQPRKKFELAQKLSALKNQLRDMEENQNG